ncbi:hypothetical protein AcV5_004090 [Taiwanofungus camphoratus]|nr:hypothetical protein AcV5_004090 [Antrodia cinnamomea]
MNDIARELAKYLVQRLHAIPPTSRLLVGLSGVPASGKSTLARLVVDYVNSTWRTPLDSPDSEDTNATCSRADCIEEIAVLIGLDGWHLTRAQLDALPDPKLAHDRRGAHWTFDGDAYVDFVHALRLPHAPPSVSGSASTSDVIYAPSFDHALKDPTPHAIPIHPYRRVIVIEGLYSFLGILPWREAAEMLDERWWLDISEEEAERRLVVRHVKTGVAKDLEEAMWRSRENDAPSEFFIICSANATALTW